MADYNIYIHSDSEQASSNPTEPWGSTPKNNDQSDFASNVQKAFNVAQNPDSLISSAISKTTKAIPAIAVAFAVVRFTDKIASDVISINTIKSGDYRASTRYSDFKSVLSATFRPVSTAISHYKTMLTIQNQNERNALQRELLGDSVLTGSDTYGV